MSNFYIVKVIPGQPEQPVGDAGQFETGPDAAKQAKILTDKTGIKHQPRRLNQTDPDAWKEREREAAKTRRPLPKNWQALKPNPDHFLHVREDAIGFVFYFPNNEAGMLNKVVKTKPGRYLKEFFPTLNEEHAKALGAEVENMTDVLFARTGEEMRWVYENGPSSCMSNKAQHYNTENRHPCEIYAGGDLALAYFTTGEGTKRRATTRVICHPERKQYGRIYGDTARMRRSLEAMGYKEVTTFGAGIRMQRIPMKTQGSYVASYFDNFGWMIDEGDHLVTIAARNEAINHRDHIGKILVGPGQSNGRTSAHRYCPKAGNSQIYGADGEWHRVHGVDQEWSPQALRYHAFQCPITKKYWPREFKYLVEIRTPHIEHWSKEGYDKALAEGKVFTCAVIKAHYPIHLQAGEHNGKPVSVDGHVTLRANEVAEQKRKMQIAEQERARRALAEREQLGVFSSVEAKERPKKERVESAPQYRTVLRLNGSMTSGTNSTVVTDYVANTVLDAAGNEEVRA